ncbi:MAG TPA: biotin transporter BioY [Acidimicrobiia bacterium]|jgi:biotin transport system substrate-specific component
MSYAPVITARAAARSRLATAALVVGVAALTALAAQWYIPMWPVPVTGQTLVVLLGGAALGWKAGAAAQVLYLLVGSVGFPVFSEASGGIDILFGPTATTAGYLLAFPVAAGLVGRAAQARHDRRFWSMVRAFLAGSAVIYAGGVIGLQLVLGIDTLEALRVGVVPFLVGDAIKAAIAGVLLPGAWRLVGE